METSLLEAWIWVEIIVSTGWRRSALWFEGVSSTRNDDGDASGGSFFGVEARLLREDGPLPS